MKPHVIVPFLAAALLAIASGCATAEGPALRETNRPAASGFSAGRIELTARPSYDAAAGDQINTLFHIGQAPYGAPSLSLVESDRLTFILTYSDYTSDAVSLPYREAVWKAGDTVRVTAVWRTTGSDPFLALEINGAVVGVRSIREEPGLDAEAQRLFIGRQWKDGLHPFRNEVELTAFNRAPGAEAAELSARLVESGQVIPPEAPGSPGSGSSDPPGADRVPAEASRIAPEESAGPTDADRFGAAGGIGTPAGVPDGPSTREAKPAPREWQSVPGYGTQLMRLTDDSDRGGFATQVYSQLQAFSPDGRYVLLTSDTGYRVLSFPDGADVRLESSWWNAPRWNPARPHHIVAYDANDDASLSLLEIDVSTGEAAVLFSFPDRYERIVGSKSFDAMSRDGRWIAGLASTDRSRSIFALDLERRRLGTEVPLDSLQSSAGRCNPDPSYGVMEPDWIGVSPRGGHLVVQWVRDWGPRSGACSGLEAWSLIDGSFHGRIANGHAHGDLGVLGDGQEVFYTVALASPEDPNRPAVVYHELPVPEATQVVSAAAEAPYFLQTIPWGAAAHLSAQGPPGVVLIGSGAFDPATGRLERLPRAPFLQELALIFEDSSVLRLARTATSSCGYWAQARATLSPDGDYVAFASDWYAGTGETGCSDAQPLGAADLYVLKLR
jgi:hypothetical protein